MNVMRRWNTIVCGHRPAGAFKSAGQARERQAKERPAKERRATDKQDQERDTGPQQQRARTPMQRVTRRAALAGSVSAAAAVALPLLSANAASPPAGQQTPGIYRYRIGAFELTALYDGIWYRPI